MKKLTILVTAGLLSAILASTSFAGPGKGCQKWEHRGEKGGSIQQLDLSEEQKTAIDAVRAAHREQRRSDRQANKSDVCRTVTPGQANYDEQVQACAKYKAAKVESKIISKSKLKAEIYALLTPEQQAKLTELKQERQEKRAERRERRNK